MTLKVKSRGQTYNQLSRLIILTTLLQIATPFCNSVVQAHGSWSKDVTVLTDSNFEVKVLKSKHIWMVNFYAPWCPHCQKLQPVYEKAALAIKKAGIDNVKLGAIDASDYKEYAQKFGIRGFPTLKYFPAGAKQLDDVKEFASERSVPAILEWAKKMAAESRPPPELVQMTNGKIFNETCETSQLCIVAVLPPLYDCQSECRNKYLDRLREVADTFKNKPWGYLWVEALAYREFEKALNIGGFGYPAMAVVNIRKMAFSLLRGPFSTEGITEFLRELSYGRGTSSTIKGAKMPNIEKTKPWDGKDMKLPVSDEL